MVLWLAAGFLVGLGGCVALFRGAGDPLVWLVVGSVLGAWLYWAGCLWLVDPCGFLSGRWLVLRSTVLLDPTGVDPRCGFHPLLGIFHCLAGAVVENPLG